MVAISLYRGNLHKVPDVPRRWLPPNPKITLKDFRSLLQRRSRSLTRFRASTSSAAVANSKPPEETAGDNRRGRFESNSFPRSEPSHVSVARGADDTRGDIPADAMNRDGFGDGPVPWSEPKPLVVNKDGRGNSPHEMTGVSGNPNSEANLTGNNVCVLSEDKRRKEVEEKLQFLNGKKHNLVQLLKQILNAEEELKRHNLQALLTRPPIPLQDVLNESGSVGKQVCPRTGSEGNLGGHMESGEADDLSNCNMHSRHLVRMSSLSPSSESPIKRPGFSQHNAAPHPSRANLGTTGSPSPSRFAPIGHQGMPTVSVSGTNYIASSPSPAASGGTSVFRDARLPSPWS